MKLVNLQEKTCLLLDGRWLPFHLITSRRCFELLIRNKIQSLDPNFSPIRNCNDWFAIDKELLAEDQPFIRSAKDAWPLPTVAVLNSNYYKNHTVKKNISFDDMYRLFKGECQICFKRFKRHQLTVEHVNPISKSHNNEDFNKTLTCKKCNNAKSDKTEYEDIYGKPLQGITVNDYFRMKFNVDEPRKEWEHFFINAK